MNYHPPTISKACEDRVMKFVFAILGFALVACGGPQSSNADAGTQATAAPAGPPKIGQVGSFTLVNDAKGDLPVRTVSFGQIFRPGEVRPGNLVEVELDGRLAPTQMDAKALNPDGSVRHAVMTVTLPRLQSSQRLKGVLVNKPGKPSGRAATYVPVPDMDVAVTLRPKGGSPRVANVNLRRVALDSKTAAGGSWLKGPVAQERRFTADVTENLQVVFDVFTPKAGPARVDVSFHNDWTGTSQKAAINYDVLIRLSGAPVYRAAAVRHYPFSTWHRLVWTDGAPDIRVIPNLADLQAAAAIPRYDAGFAVASSIRDEVAKGGGVADRAPLDSAMITQYMPNTGGRMDIGPLPTWSVVDLLEGSAATRRAVLANGDAAGAIPWHIRDRKTGRPLSLDDHPDLWLDSRGEDSVEGVLPEAFNQESNGWTIDDAHQPSLTYLPYLLTGRQYYRDELTQQAAYNLLSYDADYRGGAAGLIIGKNGDSWQQVRAMAWFLRTLANAAYILPSDDPMQAYFDQKLRGNLAKLVQVYVTDRKLKDAGPVEGWIPGAMDEKDTLAPWMQGFLAVVLTWTNDMGYADAGRTVGFMSNFLSGLYTSKDKGLDPALAVAYELPVRDYKQDRLYNTWAEVYKESDLDDISSDEIRETFGDYAMIMRAANAGAFSITGSPKAEQAYKYLSANLGRIESQTARGDPTFAILPAARPAVTR